MKKKRDEFTKLLIVPERIQSNFPKPNVIVVVCLSIFVWFRRSRYVTMTVLLWAMGTATEPAVTMATIREIWFRSKSYSVQMTLRANGVMRRRVFMFRSLVVIWRIRNRMIFYGWRVDWRRSTYDVIVGHLVWWDMGVPIPIPPHLGQLICIETWQRIFAPKIFLRHSWRLRQICR